MFEQTLDMRRVLWLLRRQWWIVAACVFVGALIPTVAMLWNTTSYTSTSLVLVPTSANSGSSGGSNGGPGNNNTTDSAIAESAAVLTAAASKVTPHITLQAAQSRVKAAAVATNLVQITATGSSPRAAEALANAVANRLVVFVTSSDVSNGSSALAGLEAQAAALTTQVNKYNQEIQLEEAAIQSSSPSSSVARSDTQLLGSLTTAQSNASLQLQSVNSQIAAAKLNNAVVNGGTEVIQHASSASEPFVIQPTPPDRRWCHSRVSHWRRLCCHPAAEIEPLDPRRDRLSSWRPRSDFLRCRTSRRILGLADAAARTRAVGDRDVERPQGAQLFGCSRVRTTRRHGHHPR